MAKYRVLQDAYMPPGGGKPPRLMRPGSTVEYAGVPGAHLEPLDEEARHASVMAKARGAFVDPIRTLPLVNGRTEAEALRRVAAGITPEEDAEVAERLARAENRAAALEEELLRLRMAVVNPPEPLPAPPVAKPARVPPPPPKTP